MPSNLLLILGVAPSSYAAGMLVNTGCVVVNGVRYSAVSYYGLKVGDIFQLNMKMRQQNKFMFSYHRWAQKAVRLAGQFSFLQADWSMLMFGVVSMPKPFEIINTTFLSERWLRYYIRQFPVKLKKYSAVKTVWRNN